VVLEFLVPVASAGLTWVSISGGSLALALLVVVLDTILAPLRLPLSKQGYLGQSVPLDPVAFLGQMLLVVAAPATAGLLMNELSR
jgi:predicted Na+-dependent transporter